MARYGGGSEDFKNEAERLAQLRAQRERLAAQEMAYRKELEATTGAEEEAAVARERSTRARREERDAGERGARVKNVEAEATRLDTAAIRQNTAAREANARAARQQANFSRGLAGARDPAFSAAYGLRGPTGDVTQYRLRQQLQEVGSRRAASLQAAVRAGFVPQTGAEATRPLTRARAATVALEQAESELAAATRAQTNLRRRTTATEDEILAADDARRSAKTKRDAARLELQSAEQHQASTREADAMRTQAAEREAAAARGVGPGPGTALIRHPTEFGRRVPGPFGAQAIPIPGTDRPGARVELGAAGRLHGENAAYNLSAQAQRAEAAAMRQKVAIATENEAAMAHAADQEIRFARATREAAVDMGLSSQQLQRHGALTAEFIAAAARGEVTIREFGNQMLLTAGKFAGWTAAAGAIFGVLGAVRQLGEGAVQSQAGVHTLTRVINDVNADRAQSSFRELSRSFNVPINEAVDAVYRMGQVFHNQEDAVEAARAALFSFKTGEVDVATSTQNLIAIVRGFGLSSGALLSVYDQINQAQNTFGIRIGDTEAGLAKAAGTYRNAGGDLNYLLALTVAIGKATNRSGQEIGTGLARGVNQIRQARNQAKLEAQGVVVDPLDFQSTIQSALQAARRPGADLQQIATGLFGNQYARLIAPVLADQTTLNDAIRDTSPEASKNSAQKELAKVLRQVDEQAKRLGYDLQQLGSNLAEAHLFDIFGGLLKLLDQVLHGADRLLEAFNKLPSGLRQSIVYGAQLLAIMAAARRFGFGARVGDAVSGGGNIAMLARRGARDQLEGARRVQEGASRARFDAAANLETEQRALRQMAYGTDAFNTQMLRIQAAEADLDRARSRSAAAAEVTARAEGELATVRKLNRAEAAAYVERHGIPTPPTAGRPTSARPVYREPLGSPEVPIGAAAIQQEEAAVAAAAAERSALSRRLLGEGPAYRALDKSASAVKTAANASIVAARRGGGRLRELGTSLREFEASLGVFEYGFAAFIAAELVIGKLQDTIEKNVKEADDRATQALNTNREVHQMIEATDRPNRSLLRRDVGGAVGATFPGRILGAVRDFLNPAAQEREFDNARARLIERAQSQANILSTRTQGNLTQGTLVGQVREANRLRQRGIISVREFDKGLDQAIKDAAHSTLDPAHRAAFVAFAESYRLPTYRRDEFRGASTTQAMAALQGTAVRVQAQGQATTRDLTRAGRAYNAIAQTIAGDRSDQALKQLLDAQQALDAVADALGTDLENELEYTRSNRRRRGLIRNFRSQLRATYITPARESLHTARAQEDTDRARLDALRAQREGLRGAHGTDDVQARQQIEQKIQAQQDRIAQDEKNQARARADLERGRHQTRARTFKEEQQQAQRELQDIQAQGQLAQAQAGGDPVAVARAAYQSAQNVVRYMRSHRSLFSNADIIQALAILVQSKQAINDEVQKDAQAARDFSFDIQAARDEGNPLALARDHLAKARDHLARATKPEEVRQAKLDVQTANNEIAQALRDQFDAHIDLLESQTTDPVVQARLEVRKARRHLRDAQGPAARDQARADVNKANQGLLAANIQSREDDIDFNLEMEKITKDEAISQYEALAHTRGITKQTRREILRRIKQLKDESQSESAGFDLDVGQIKLPTVYDVRRAFGGVRAIYDRAQQDLGTEVPVIRGRHRQRARGADVAHARADLSGGVTQNLSFNIRVEKTADAAEVYSAIDRALGTKIRAKARSRGRRG